MHVGEPVRDFKITITEWVIPGDPTDPIAFFGQLECNTLDELRVYFHRRYSVAKSLGYILKVKPDPSTYNERVVGRLAIQFTERFQTIKLEFRTVADLVKFLKKQPLVATLAGYHPHLKVQK